MATQKILENVTAPIIEEKMEHTSPIMLSTSPVIFSVSLYSLIPRIMPIIDVICPIKANNHAKTIPIIPRIKAADVFSELMGEVVARQDPNFRDGRTKKFTLEQIDLALSLLAHGRTYRQITTITGISKSTLIRVKNQGA